MTGLTFSMLDGRKEKTNKQKTKFSSIILEESYVLNKHHGLVLKCQI